LRRKTAVGGKQCRKATLHFIHGKIIQDFQRKKFELQVKTAADFFGKI